MMWGIGGKGGVGLERTLIRVGKGWTMRGGEFGSKSVNVVGKRVGIWEMGGEMEEGWRAGSGLGVVVDDGGVGKRGVGEKGWENGEGNAKRKTRTYKSWRLEIGVLGESLETLETLETLVRF